VLALGAEHYLLFLCADVVKRVCSHGAPSHKGRERRGRERERERAGGRREHERGSRQTERHRAREIDVFCASAGSSWLDLGHVGKLYGI